MKKNKPGKSEQSGKKKKPATEKTADGKVPRKMGTKRKAEEDLCFHVL